MCDNEKSLEMLLWLTPFTKLILDKQAAELLITLHGFWIQLYLVISSWVRKTILFAQG